MKFATVLFAATLILFASPVLAGELHPQLEAQLSLMQSNEPISVIVHMTEQAPIVQMKSDLLRNKSTRQVRHEQIVLALKNATSSQDALKAELDARIITGSVMGYTSHWISNLIVVKASREEIERIARRSDVDIVEPNFTVSLMDPVSSHDVVEGHEADPVRQIGITPGVKSINADRVWYELGITGAGRLIGSLDTGVDGNHEALSSRWRGVFHPVSECWLDVIGAGGSFPTDSNSHGTHTTGTMCGVAFDDTVGVAWDAQWIACNAIDQGVSSDFDNDVIVAFEWFADPDNNPFTVDDVPDVVQNSWRVNEGFPGGYTDCDTRWWAAIDNAEAAGVVTCWSAGNEGPSSQTIGSPPDRATTLTSSFSIGAADATNYNWPYPIASFSSRGPSGCPGVPPENLIKPEVCGPGVDVYSATPGSNYGYKSGTSMSGPHVAGVVALMRQANPNLDVDTIKLILMQTARDLGNPGEDNTFGNGYIDAYEAVLAALSGYGEMEGYVYNSTSGNNPIPGASVELLGETYRYTSDGAGYYHGFAPSATYTARASAPGFASQDVTVEIPEDGILQQDFYLVDNDGPQIANVSQPLATSDVVGPYAISATVVDNSSVSQVKLFHQIGAQAWQEVVMTNTGGDTYSGDIPGAPANSLIHYYVWAQDGAGLMATEPGDAPDSFFDLYITAPLYTYEVEDPEDPYWTISDDAGLTAGTWERGDPIGVYYTNGGFQIQPEDDHTPDPGVQCFLTGNDGSQFDGDVDGGCTTLLTPTFDLSETQLAFVSYWRWYSEGGLSTDDEFEVSVSSDGGSNWVLLELVDGNQNSWQRAAFNLGDVITLTDQVVVRFVACDLGSGGLVEAAIDDFAIDAYSEVLSDVPGAETPALRHVNLDQNRPNPFNPATDISFELPVSQQVELSIFTVDGKLVNTLLKERMAAGSHAVSWNGLDQNGRHVASGTYFYRLDAGESSQTKRMTLVK